MQYLQLQISASFKLCSLHYLYSRRWTIIKIYESKIFPHTFWRKMSLWIYAIMWKCEITIQHSFCLVIFLIRDFFLLVTLIWKIWDLLTNQKLLPNLAWNVLQNGQMAIQCLNFMRKCLLSKHSFMTPTLFK